MTPYFSRDGITIYHGEALSVLPDLPSAGLVVTDPPYSFGMASAATEEGNGQRARAGWADMMNASRWYGEVLTALRAKVEPRDGAAWIFNSWRSFPVLARASHDAGWPIESLMVWDKGWMGMGGMRGLRPSYELVALFVAGDFAMGDRAIPDIERERWVPAHRQNHPAEKPAALVERLIYHSGGEALKGPILDPFMGSGTTLVAARNLGLPAIGIEAEEVYCEVAAKRLAQGNLFGVPA